jgi:tol-pal system protein YbgF
MKTLRSVVILAAATLAAAGCVSTSDFEQTQHQVAELQDQLANISRTTSSKEDVQNVNVRIGEQTEMLLRSNATLVGKVDDIEQRIQSSQGSLEQSAHRMDRLAQQIAQLQREIEELRARMAALHPGAIGGGASSSEVTVPARAPSVDPSQIYQAAYRDYQRGNFDLAIEGFTEFIASSPESDLADNAAYWIGESLFSQKKYRDAIAQFDTVVTRYPRSDKVPGALLKKGYSYISLGERAQGIVQLQYVVHEHPRSQEAALARQRLSQLGVETR